MTAARAATRQRIEGVRDVTAALDRDAVRVLLVDAHASQPEIADLVARAQAASVHVWRGSSGDLRRMSRCSPPSPVLALVGPSLTPTLPELLSRGGITWLLHGAAYPSNAGFVVRTAEVSGADGVVIDAAFNHDERARIAHVSMGALWLLPVLWERTDAVIEHARALGTRCVAIEDAGTIAPWDADLRGPLLCIVGGERSGLGADVLSRCDEVVRIPMAGFVPSYNLQAAMSAVAIERLRQLRA